MYYVYGKLSVHGKENKINSIRSGCLSLIHSMFFFILGSFFSIWCMFSPERCSHHCFKHQNKYCYATGVFGWCLVLRSTSSTTVFSVFFLFSLLHFYSCAHINPISSVYWFELSVFELPALTRCLLSVCLCVRV